MKIKNHKLKLSWIFGDEEEEEKGMQSKDPQSCRKERV